MSSTGARHPTARDLGLGSALRRGARRVARRPACVAAWGVVAPDPRPPTCARRLGAGSATASSTACCSRCSRWRSPSAARVAAGRCTACPAPCSSVAIPVLLSLVVIRLTCARARRDLSLVVRWVPRHRAQRSRGWRGSRVVLWVIGRAARWCWTRWTTSTGSSATTQDVAAQRPRRHADRPASCWCIALWMSAAIEKQLPRRRDAHDLSLRKIAANVVRALLLFVGLLLALSAVGIDLTALIGARRRDRRRPRLRPAEDRRQLRQRLRHPRRAEPAHRRHGARSTTSKAASPTSARATR